MVLLQFVTGVLLVLLLLRIAHILTSNPIGELAEELLYLRSRELRWPAILGLSALLLEAVEFVYPMLADWLGIVRSFDAFGAYLNGVQSLLILVGTVQVFLLMRRYTSKGLRDRIRDSMEVLALKGGSSNRRRPREGSTDEES